MLAAVLHDREDLRIEEVSQPVIREDEVLLRIRAAAICGTDLRIYRHGHSRLPSGVKRILGHEISGEVAEVGGKVMGLAENMRVAVAPNFGCGWCRMCRRGWFHHCPEYGAIGLTVDGGFAEYVRIPAISVQQGCLLELPAGVSFEEGALNEPFACVYNGYQRCPVEPGDIVLIVGAGPIGMMQIKMAQVAGASKIIVAEKTASRLELASHLDAVATIDTNTEAVPDVVMRLTSGYGADVIIIACPSPEMQEQSPEAAACHARINFFGGLPEDLGPISFNSNLIHYKELTVTGSHGCCTYHCQKALELQSSGRIDLKPLVTDSFDLAKAGEAMASALAGNGLKTIIKP